MTIEQTITKLREDLDRAFLGKPTPERVQELRAKLTQLQQDLTPAAGSQVTAAGQLTIFTRLRDILVVYKEVMVPILLDLEKQRLEIVLRMAKAQGAA